MWHTDIVRGATTTEQCCCIISTNELRGDEVGNLGAGTKSGGKRQFKSRIKLLENALQCHLKVSQEAIWAMKSLKQELTESRDRNRCRVQSDLQNSRLLSHSQAGPSHFISWTITWPVQRFDDDATARLRAQIEKGKISLDDALSKAADARPSVPPLLPNQWAFFVTIDA